MNSPSTQCPPNHTAPVRTVAPDPYFRAPRGPGHGTQPRNGLATAAMVVGAIGVVTSIGVIGGPLGVIGLLMGLVARRAARRTGAGRAEATTAVVTSSVAIVVSALAAAFMVWYAHRTQDCYHLNHLRPYTQCVRRRLFGG